MKKVHATVLITLAFVLGTMFGGSALAYKAVAVFINGERLDDTGSMAMIYNDRVFVPLRLVSESLGVTVGWNAERNSAYIATQRDALTDIEIVGNDEFKEAMTDSLELLKEKAPEEYLLVGKYVKRIVFNGSIKAPKMYSDDMEVHIPIDGFRADRTWWAAMLAHEAQHAKQAYDATGQRQREREIEAGLLDIEVLKKVGASSRQIEYSEEIQKTEWWLD